MCLCYSYTHTTKHAKKLDTYAGGHGCAHVHEAKCAAWQRFSAAGTAGDL